MFCNSGGGTEDMSHATNKEAKDIIKRGKVMETKWTIKQTEIWKVKTQASFQKRKQKRRLWE